MKQVLQNQRSGDLSVVEVPIPTLQRGRVLVRTVASLISVGTERMSLELAQRSLVGKAIERPDLVKQVVQKVQREGLVSTVNAVSARLDSTKALGYSAAGVVVDVSSEVNEFRVGDRVACAGAGFAAHAEVISVPRNLCVRLPESIDFEAGAFGTLGAIALQGVRLIEPSLGEAVVVIGLGLLGQITVQLLKANGCRVFGVDLNPARVKLARDLGADVAVTTGSDVKGAIIEWSRGRGADAVLIAAATSSNEPLELAGEVSRRKGRVVAVGLVGLDVPRQIFYERELTLKISMSYGPGRYDPEYEEHGHDYPFAYVRWTENRNIEAFLDLVAGKQINVEPLISHRFPLEHAERAYELIGSDSTSYLGIILSYDTKKELHRSLELRNIAAAGNSVKLGLIGAGNYVRSTLLPHFKSAGVGFQSITSASGISAQDVGKKFGFAKAVASLEEILLDEEINLVVIGTRHDTHAQLAIRALQDGKNVFVEKPLALNDEELDSVIEAATNSSGRLMVGFNRRFSPLALAGKEVFAGRADPLSILYRVNPGRLPREHWVQDSIEGGGRIIGEVCHFIDLMQFLTESLPESVFAECISSRNHQLVDEDSVFITLRFADGSTGCIAYLAEGDTSLSKERIEIFGEGKSFVLDDFRSAVAYTSGRQRKTKLRRQDKGQTEEVRKVFQMVLDGAPAPISLAELAATTRATFRIRDSLRLRQPVRLDQYGISSQGTEFGE
ncbi:MAG TPA: bi-domain-containing oxidoreductase [Pyrinomonadaceae bacterium]|nr:bi-domain-containing oxidoreductase [Pyrinomonadaceae bacterium]